MSVAVPDLHLPGRSRAWRWWICGLLLLATMVNYMDRLTLNLLAPRIQREMHLSDIDYGNVEGGFAVAFAFGAIVVGWIADRGNTYWVYPVTLLVWSAAGIATGFTQGFFWLFACRFVLGFAESGHWPCALRTTQHLLPPAERTMGNSILQSGAAFGSILIPLIVYFTVDPAVVGSWRGPFLVVGACGASWAVLWALSLRPRDLTAPVRQAAPEPERPTVSRWLLARRFIALVVLVTLINATWHFFRVWLSPLLAQLGYEERERNLFISAYYVAAGLGSLSAGYFTLLLTRRGLSVHVSRLAVFLAYGLLTGLAVWATFLPAGPLLLAVLLVVGFGSLGVFPAYYSFSQELTVRRQGLLTGLLGFACWMALAAWQVIISHVKTYTNSFSACMILSGVLPLVGFAVLVVLWGRDEPRTAQWAAEPTDDSPMDIQGVDHANGVLTADGKGITR